jgi:glycogen debranching enzyme
VMLAGAYADRTGDLGVPRHAVARAHRRDGVDRRARRLEWRRVPRLRALARHRASPTRDGRTASIRVFHADGRLPHGPIALLEGAGLRLRGVSRDGGPRTAARRRRRAGALARAARCAACRGRGAVLDGRLRFYAIALDGDGKLCRVRASNAGHLLYTGLPSPEHARAGSPAIARRRRSTTAGASAR